VVHVLTESDTPGATGMTLQGASNALIQWQLRLPAAGTGAFALDREYLSTWYNVLSVDRATGFLTYLLASVPKAANNTAARAAGVAVGGFYRTNADPSVLCIRSA
jgi:hypothetical protein